MKALIEIAVIVFAATFVCTAIVGGALALFPKLSARRSKGGAA